MDRRARAITVVGWLFIAVGAVGFLYHASEFTAQPPHEKNLVWICGVRLLAVVGGAFLLFARNWARWLLGAWMAFHIVMSALHSAGEFLMHLLLFGVISYFLFRPAASAYFRQARPKLADDSKRDG